MPRLEQALANDRAGGRGSLLPYLLVDRGRLRRTRALAAGCRSAGATAIELGFPFSDPLADGATLATASSRALRNGTTWRDLLSAVRDAAPELPVVVMTYANPVFRHGVRPALLELRRAGASGIVIPDLDLEDSGPWRRDADAAEVSLVLMAAPSTDLARAARLARASSGYLYLVGRYGTTGARGSTAETTALRRIIQAVKSARAGLPVLVGFGLSRPAQARSWRALGADGAIVGSAFEAAIGPSGDPDRAMAFLSPIGRALAAGANRSDPGTS